MATETKQLPQVGIPVADNLAWRGYTIDELRMARAKSLLHREMGRLQLQTSLDKASARAKEHGVRGLLFNNNVVASLNKVDYFYLAFRAVRLITKMMAKRRR